MLHNDAFLLDSSSKIEIRDSGVYRWTLNFIKKAQVKLKKLSLTLYMRSCIGFELKIEF